MILFLLSGLDALSQQVTTYYLIRHSEKNLSEKTNRNSHLSFKGIQRAEQWKNILKEIPFDIIYSTPYHRTTETVKPISEARKLPITTYDPKTLFDNAFEQTNRGKTILVVGHSNTTPSLANKILAEERFTQIEENVYGNLYIIQRIDQLTTAQLLSIE